MKRVKQISLDIAVHPNIDGDRLSEEVAEALENLGYMVLGAGFQCDLTDEYEEHYPDLL
jgi:hypothetical protein